MVYVRPDVDQGELRKRGFVLMWPEAKEYAFLMVSQENERWVRDQDDLGVIFLRDPAGNLQTTSREEVDVMLQEVTGKITTGAEVKVTDGPYQNLEGTVMGEVGGRLQVLVEGFNRRYEVVLDRDQVLLVREVSQKLELEEELEN